ncbi:hypothetical protein Ddye_025112 [Dipteronia dyeriana]|uniref:NB-ARC domain-containing protein n=1 Tax=Dipteronia dyeriana TaxID=168575 RepID=A0AAD9WTL5_9ROSI|nr:hypothetical protein Ddye_025112 [Dipteronia dyeriana]
MEEIRGHLMGNEIQKIGVCGIGGAGKTTIVTHLNNRLIEDNKFNHVIWVTVSQTLELIKVQCIETKPFRERRSKSTGRDIITYVERKKICVNIG